MSERTFHPAAAGWPMRSDQGIRELADSIAELGLLHPIVLDTDGRIIDGRNRFTACGVAGVEPRFETYEGDPVLYMIAANGPNRRHQPLPEQAASVALSLALDGRRKDGRWAYGVVKATDPKSDDRQDSAWATYMSRAGLVYDHLGKARLKRVAHGKEALDSAVQDARVAKEQEERRRNLPTGLQAKVEAGDLTLDEAERYSRLPERHARLVEAGELELEEAEHLNEREERERRESLDRAKSALESFLYGWPVAVNLRENAEREAVLDLLSDHDRESFLAIEESIR